MIKIHVYRNEDTDTTVIQKESCNRNLKSEGYKFIEEIEGKDWNDCIDKFNKKYSNNNPSKVD